MEQKPSRPVTRSAGEKAHRGSSIQKTAPERMSQQNFGDVLYSWGSDIDLVKVFIVSFLDHCRSLPPSLCATSISASFQVSSPLEPPKLSFPHCVYRYIKSIIIYRFIYLIYAYIVLCNYFIKRGLIILYRPFCIFLFSCSKTRGISSKSSGSSPIHTFLWLRNNPQYRCTSLFSLGPL